MAIVGEILSALGAQVVRQSETLDVLRQAAEQAIAEKVRADSADRRSQAMCEADARKALQERYDQVFDAFGEAAPRPVANADPADYRYDLLRLTKKKLGREDDRPVTADSATTIGDLARMPLRDLSEPALDAVEPQYLAAARQQAETPHVSTLGPPGTFVARHRIDDESGSRKTEFYGRESFVKSMPNYLPGRRISRIIDPTSGRVLVGKDFPRVPGY